MYESTKADQPQLGVTGVMAYMNLFRWSSATLASPILSRSCQNLDLRSPLTSATDRVSTTLKQIASCTVSHTANRKITSGKISRSPRTLLSKLPTFGCNKQHLKRTKV